MDTVGEISAEFALGFGVLSRSLRGRSGLVVGGLLGGEVVENW